MCINSQLFGHKKGAFTDAVSDQKGFFEAAEGGTIFLDEIGDIPANTQTRILRALEQKEVMRIGETQVRQIDARILVATNKDLEEEVEQGRFRLDLLYRLRIARVHLPALRERSEDVPLLVEAFLGQSRASMGKTLDGIDQDAMRALMDHDWPGNVRELKNAISFAAIHCKGAVIGVKDLPPEIFGRQEHRQTGRDYDPTSEKERILHALESTGGNRGEAARLLGIGRATLYRRMKACFIKPGDLPKRANWGG
ncbi:MAG: sigma 54-interacting transcriptional regulator [Verrucomicrobia bacterium]|nr:sigma 54-interacting transcriptional regulator [Verrucomicrobiota bacterium]